MTIQWERNPYVRKHVHRWVIARRELATFGEADYATPGWPRKPAQPLKLHRRCEDCRARETAHVPDESVLIPGYEAIADLDWSVPAAVVATLPAPSPAPLPIPVPSYPPTPPTAPMYPPFAVGDAVRHIQTGIEGIVTAVDLMNATIDWNVPTPPYGPMHCYKQAFNEMELV